MARDAFTLAYLEAMLWGEEDDNGVALEENYTDIDIEPAGLAKIEADCAAFQAENAALIKGRERRAGHNFYLTRNHHGAGFWDGWQPELDGIMLTKAAHTYGTQGLEVGNDGKLHVHS